MKLHELDWNEVLRELPRWEALSPDARRAFLGIKPGQGFALEPLGVAGAEMWKAGLLVAPTGRGTLYALDPALRPLLMALRAADRLCPLPGPGGMLRHGYVEDQLNTFQSYRIAAPPRSYYDPRDRRLAAEAVSSVAWARGFLAAETHAEVVKWEERWTTQERPRLVVPEVAQTLRGLVLALAGHPAGVPLASVRALVPDAPPAALAAALAAGLRYLLVFVSVGRSANAVVGLLPAVATRLAGAARPPQPVQARETFSAPFRVGDMTAVLVEAATEPIPVRASDGTLYVRVQRAIGARLASVPGWVQRFAAARNPLAENLGEDGADDDEAAGERVDEAAEFAKELRLASTSSGNMEQFRPTPAGRAWLNRGEGERIKEVLSALRALEQRNPTGFGYMRALDFFGALLPFTLDEGKADLRAALSAAFLALPPGALVPLAEFARYHAQQSNPFLGPHGATAHVRSYWSSEPRTLEGWEAIWGNLLLAFVARRLVPLGCAVLGRTEDGTVAFGLTDAGRYLLGAVDQFELAPEPGGEVVVQPDFEIVFLAPAARAEAELARIAERTGSGVGALFRLTRASVLRAAEQGMTAAQLLGTLESVSRGGVPDNVARQVRDWMKAVRTIRIAPAVLVDCPDAETAGRVKAMGGAHVTSVTPTLLRLDGDARTRAALVKRLRDKGIFVASADGAPASASTRRR